MIWRDAKKPPSPPPDRTFGQIKSARTPINCVGTLFKRGSKAAESGLEHRPHQYGEGATPEFIFNEEFDIAGVLVDRMKGPAILHAPERSAEVFHQNLQIWPVESHAAGEGL